MENGKFCMKILSYSSILTREMISFRSCFSIYPVLHNNIAISDNLSVGFLTWIRVISNRFKIYACRIWFPPNKRTTFHCCEIRFETEKIEFDKSFRDPQGVAQYVHTIRAKLLKDRFRYYVSISRFLYPSSRVYVTLFRLIAFLS